MSLKSSLPSEMYLLWKKFPGKYKRKQQQKYTSVPYERGAGRDPVGLGSILENLARNWGWLSELQTAEIIDKWREIVGESVAAKTKIIFIEKGVITVECSSTSWATELRRIRAEILTKINAKYPESNITELKFVVSGVPTWRHGPRSVRGQGPRDTYK